MVPLRDFRLGDLVLYNNQKCYIRGIEENQLKLEHNGKIEIVSPEWVSPIPLTEDILLKIGFEVSDTEDSKAKPYREYNYNGIVINLFRIGEPVFLYCADDTFKGNTVTYSRPPLKYVHQLQNLIFVLTGKELNITFD